ncbi:hypothetical protein BN134_256 [Cronobacter dublinensis 1210]|uniref:Uncharacterized protein n=1 Tax=Cronobacter dublinensis 1210 TaxID=1208656 RepID=A0ABM9Q2G4_9ENTR|nr:hypothetical protein [Cronobacter dublinensis]ALB67895.1 hypothetical protein AFK67_16015 [Cronobacter dublinensis subsp. dublinensis LMG 23823]MDI7272735.1 hypothetical protein [Cronobacter dublinensis]CCJ79552.1 hypothetical protein BN134_256 [Cronobacter dublinensis 1210]
MNKQIKDLIATIKKIDIVKITDEESLDDDTKVMRFENKDEQFFMMIKNISEEYIVINTSNPVSLEEMHFNKPIKDLVNDFNTFAVGTKAIISDEEKSHFLFVREEIIRVKDVLNKDLLKARISLSLDLIKSAIKVFETINDEIKENGKS